MTNQLFVGNLPWSVTEDDLKEHFESVGKVFAVKIIKDKKTGRSKGYGFINMNNVDKAIEQLNGKFIQERPLTVNKAVRKEQHESDLPGHRRHDNDSENEV